MKYLTQLLITALAVCFLAYVLPGVFVKGYVSAIGVALVLSVLNILVKPIIVLLTLPVTILTLGIFLFVINAVIIILADKLLAGFSVSGFWSALLFSILLSFTQSLLYSVFKTDKK